MTMSVPAERCAKTAYTLHGRRPRITHAGLVGPAGAALFLDIDKKRGLASIAVYSQMYISIRIRKEMSSSPLSL